MKKYFLNNILSFSIFLISTILSIVSAYYFFSNGNANLAFTDANTRLNIARGIFDNLTPGLSQFGNLWPPFPQILMIPFVFSDFLWRSGLAGWIISGISYVLTALFIYRIVCSLTKKPLYGFVAAIVFIININVLYLQSTAMAESFFWLTITANFYFLYKYLEDKKIKYLVLSAIALDISCLTRYEGYALLLGSVIIVFLSCIFNRFKLIKTAKTVFIFTIIGSLGILLWSIYLWLFTGNPFFELQYHNISSNAPIAFSTALPTYVMSVINMAGLFTALIGFVGILYILFSGRVNKNIKILLILPLSLLVLMIFVINKTTPIFQPFMSLDTLFNKSTNLYYQLSARYGLNFLIYLIIFSMIMISKIKHTIFIYVLLITIQTFAYFYSPLYLTYQLRETTHYEIPTYVSWFKKNYDSGSILIYAIKYEPEILAMNLPFKKFIHEGTGYYWTRSFSDPSRYAKWIIFDSMHQSDEVAKRLNNINLKQFGFTQVYGQNNIKIFKRY